MCENHRLQRSRVAVVLLRLVVQATARLAAQINRSRDSFEKELRLFLFLLKLYRFIFIFLNFLYAKCLFGDVFPS